jgi:hypothetical protein
VDRTALRNKQDQVANTKTTPVVDSEATRCPRCAGTPYCRQVALGWYCHTNGLQLSQQALATSVATDRLAILVDTDPDVLAAAAALQAGEDAWAKADAEWQQVTLDL